MDSREYLNYVLDKLQERIRKLDDAIHVPFCLHGFLPPPETSALVRADCVP